MDTEKARKTLEDLGHRQEETRGGQPDAVRREVKEVRTGLGCALSHVPPQLERNSNQGTPFRSVPQPDEDALEALREGGTEI